jgi:Flp pilus assembly protein TadD
LEVLDSLLAKDPENVRLIRTRGYALYLSGRTDSALATYRSALDFDPFNPDVMYNIAVILQAKGELEDAYSRATASLELREDDQRTLLLVGRLAYETNRLGEAIEHLDAYLSRNREDVEARVLLAHALRKEGFYSRALTEYDQALKDQQKNPDALFGKAVALLVGAEDVDAGLETLKAAINAGFTDSDRAEKELLVDENAALSETRQILADREIIETGEDSEDESAAPTVPQ